MEPLSGPSHTQHSILLTAAAVLREGGGPGSSASGADEKFLPVLAHLSPGFFGLGLFLLGAAALNESRCSSSGEQSQSEPEPGNQTTGLQQDLPSSLRGPLGLRSHLLPSLAGRTCLLTVSRAVLWLPALWAPSSAWCGSGSRSSMVVLLSGWSRTRLLWFPMAPPLLTR